MEEMTLREVCQTLGVSRRAVQGYEIAKLVSATRKTESGHLLYNQNAQSRIKKIKLFQEMGFTIKEIQTIIDAPADILREALIRREKCLKQRISHTNEMISIIHDMLNTL